MMWLWLLLMSDDWDDEDWGWFIVGVVLGLLLTVGLLVLA